MSLVYASSIVLLIILLNLGTVVLIFALLKIDLALFDSSILLRKARRSLPYSFHCPNMHQQHVQEDRGDYSLGLVRSLGVVDEG